MASGSSTANLPSLISAVDDRKASAADSTSRSDLIAFANPCDSEMHAILHRRLAGFAIRLICPAVLSIALSSLATAQHDDRGQPSPQQHPGGRPPPGKPFISPRGPIGQPPGAQVIARGDHSSRRPATGSGSCASRRSPARICSSRRAAPRSRVRPPRRRAVRLSRPSIRARAEDAVRLPTRLGLPALGSRRIPGRSS